MYIYMYIYMFSIYLFFFIRICFMYSPLRTSVAGFGIVLVSRLPLRGLISALALWSDLGQNCLEDMLKTRHVGSFIVTRPSSLVTNKMHLCQKTCDLSLNSLSTHLCPPRFSVFLL